jgi:outer membrane protein
MSEWVLRVLLAAAPTLDAQAVVEEAIAHNPLVEAAIFDLKKAEQDLGAEGYRYYPSLLVAAGATHLQSPSLLSGNGTTVQTSDNYQLASELRHTFSFGTALALRVEGTRFGGQSQFGAGGNQLVILGPGYNLLGKLSLTQPLLRGLGNQIGEAALRQARLSRTVAEHARDQAASQVLRDVLVAYWELWYNQRAVQIERSAFELAVRQKDDALARIGIGALAQVDAYTFETRVAELEQSLAAAEATAEAQSVELARGLGRGEGTGPLTPGNLVVPTVEARTLAQEVDRALEASAELQRLRTQLEVALDQATVAGESERPRLDLDAYLQAQGLGNQEIPPALQQLFGLEAVSARVGLTLELPLTGSRYQATKESAGLAASAARSRLLSSEQQLRASCATEVVRLEQARRRVTLATRTVELATKSVAAQEERYQQGDAILLQVYEAQDTLRRAQLSLERSRVDAVQASLRLDHLTGVLLSTAVGGD